MSRLVTESKTVEEPLIKYAKQAGWEYVSPEEALRLREGDSGKFFVEVLKQALIKLNSDFINQNNVDELVRKIDNTSSSIEGNKDNLDWARGYKMFFDHKEKRNRNVHLIDFNHHDKNIFHVTKQWTYTSPLKTNRPDVMFLINGIPFIIVENKRPGISNSMENAIKQLKRLERETPEILSYPQIFNVTDALQYFYGVTWNYSRKNIFNWKKEQQSQIARSGLKNTDLDRDSRSQRNDGMGGNDGVLERTKQITLEEAVLTFFDKSHVLKMIKDWILFYYKENDLQKSILKQHQTRAIKKVLTRCSESPKKRALVWHTQGSGKTFTMISTARLILSANKQATVLKTRGLHSKRMWYIRGPV